MARTKADVSLNTSYKRPFALLCMRASVGALV